MRCKLKPIPKVAVMPLGTGNDLSLTFGWGNAFLDIWIKVPGSSRPAAVLCQSAAGGCVVSSVVLSPSWDCQRRPCLADEVTHATAEGEVQCPGAQGDLQHPGAHSAGGAPAAGRLERQLLRWWVPALLPWMRHGIC